MLNPNQTDADYLARALVLAEYGRYTTHPNPCVGCVLVQQGNIVGEGYHVSAGDMHAEANALAQAGRRAKGATAYVTLEPCSFHGRTPSCADALVKAGVSRVVVATLDPDPRNAGVGCKTLEEAGIRVVTPFMEASAKALIPGHFKRYETGMPYVRLKLAMSLDGKTALANGESQWITGEPARLDVQRLRARSAAIVTGVQSVIDDDPMLTVRELHHRHGALACELNKSVFILDSHCRVPDTAKILANPAAQLVCCHPSSRQLPVPVLQLGAGDDGRVDLRELLVVLGKRQCSEVLFECGATLAGSLVEQGLFDELIIYMAPKLMGNDARSLLNVPEIAKIDDILQLRIADVRLIGQDMRVTVVRKLSDTSE
jgi:diaminohydroxyphosphoribosylaminopyrimidine deaminase/5-amino-6-(5-phosphoribosylamino)uracil reductase